MFATVDGMALARPVDTEALRRMGEWTRPVTLAGEQLLDVLAPLVPLFPEGGLRRGSTVTVDGGPGATSLALALGAAASVGGSWVAGVNLPSLGLLATAELGVALERVVVVARVAPALWATVVAALLDAVDLVWAGLPPRVAPGDARRLAARARERGSVLVPLSPWTPAARGARPPTTAGWPLPADVRLSTVEFSGWVGLATGGAGRLEARHLQVAAAGRGASARERRVSLWLPAPDGGVAPADPAPASPETPPVLCRLDSVGDGQGDKERRGEQ
ncbi:hypothetical protein BH24ACT1_BH24ACT1_08290 [soil metagenome]